MATLIQSAKSVLLDAGESTKPPELPPKAHSLVARETIPFGGGSGGNLFLKSLNGHESHLRQVAAEVSE